MIAFISSLLAAAILVLIALLHVYWTMGGYFPAKDADSLAQTVVGGQAGMVMPPVSACLLVAALLCMAAWVVLVCGGGLSPVFSLEIHRLGAFGLGGVLLLRGAGGFFDVYLRPSIKGSRYEKLNLQVYSPLCLGLAALVFMATGGR